MGLDLLPDTTSLNPTTMMRDDVIEVEFWLSPDLSITVADLVCQVRARRHAAVVATWEIAAAGYGFDDLTTDQKAALTDLTDEDGNTFSVDNTWTAVLITMDATDLLGQYVWDVQNGDPTGNTLFGAGLVVEPDVTRLD